MSNKEKALEEAKEITKGASTLKDFKALGERIVDTASAIKTEVTVASVGGALLEPSKTAGALRDKAVDAIDGALTDVRKRQKEYHDAAQDSNNSLGKRVWSSFQKLGAEFEETAGEGAKHTLEKAHFSHKSAAAEAGVAGLWMGQTGATDYSAEEKKKKEEGEAESRSDGGLLNSATTEEDREMFSGGPDSAPLPNPGLDPLEDGDAAASVKAATTPAPGKK